MGNSIGWAWWHHSKLYAKQFNEPVPQWLYEIDIGRRLRPIKLAMQLALRLPTEFLPDDAAEEKPSPRGK